MNASSVENVGLEGGGGQVASYGGLFVLGGFADSLGLGDELSAAGVIAGEPFEDRAARCGPVGEAVPVDELSFEAGEERLGDGVVR